MDAALASSSGSGSDFDDGGASLAAPGGKAGERPRRLKPRKPAPEVNNPNARDSYQAGDAVEARFGGRSKWFPGKVGSSLRRSNYRHGVSDAMQVSV